MASDDPLRVVEGSLALALTNQLIRSLHESGALPRAEVVRILQATIQGSGSPAAEQAVRHSLRRMFPEIEF